MKVKEHYEELQKELDDFLSKHTDIQITAANIDEYTEEDFARIRHTGFGASDSSKILGVNPFPNGTIDDLLYEKINQITDDTIGAKATVRMGKDLEQFIIDRFEREMKKYTLAPITVLKPKHMYGRLYNGLNTNFDGVIKEFGKFIPMEVKTISTWGRKHYRFDNALEIYPTESTDILKDFLDMVPIPTEELKETIAETIITRSKNCGIPPYYYTQLQQQIDFLKAPYGYLLVLDVNDWTIKVYKISYDEEVCKVLNSRAHQLYFKLQVATGKLEPIEDDGEDI